MKLVYSHDNAALVGYAKGLLESADIPVTEKNQYSATGMAPPYNIAAELWVLNDDDVEKAQELLANLNETSIEA